MKFNDDIKAEKTSNYFDYGVHKVQLMLFENGGTGEGEKEYVEISFCDPEDGEKTDTARVWFSTEKGAGYSFNTLRQIAVHNASEANKAKARDAVDACQDTDELVALLNEQLIGKEAWYSKYQDPTRTYTAQDGTTRRSVNKNIYGYEPKVREDLMAITNLDNVSKAAPGATDVTNDASTTVPDNWS